MAAFLVAPVLLHVAMTVAASPRAGIGIAIWICFGLAAGGGAVAAYLMILGRLRLQRPDLETWVADEGPAWHSPRIGDGLQTGSVVPPRRADQPAG